MHQDTVPCLLELAEEFDVLGPQRDDASDGSVGDEAHKARSSNHNRDDVSGSKTPQSDSDGSPDIRAIDVDDSGPWINGFTMRGGVDLIVGRCRSGVEDRLVEVIYDRDAWYASNGWSRVDYTGSNPHTEHAHFGAKADTGKLENDRRPWGLVEKWGEVMPSADEIAAATWKYAISSPSMDLGPRPAQDWLKDAEQVSRELAALGSSLRAAVGALAARDVVDEQALGRALAPGLAVALVPLLPDGGVSPAELQAALVGAFRELAGRGGPSTG